MKDEEVVNQQSYIEDRSADHKYFNQTPKIIRRAVSPHALHLYEELKGTAGEGPEGCCWKSTSTLAQQTGMSTGQVSKAKQELIHYSLITKETKQRFRHDQPYGQPVDHVYVENIWPQNMCFAELPENMQTRQNAQAILLGKEPSQYERSQKRSPDERECSPRERKRSPGETKKNPEEEPQRKKAASAATSPSRPVKSREPALDVILRLKERDRLRARGEESLEAIADASTSSPEFHRLVKTFCQGLGREPPNGKKAGAWLRSFQEQVKAIGAEYRLDDPFVAVEAALTNLVRDEGNAWSWQHAWRTPLSDTFRETLSNRVGQMLSSDSGNAGQKAIAFKLPGEEAIAL